MIRVSLNNFQKSQIQKQMCIFISKKEILQKICVLADFLEKKDCKSTSQILKTVKPSDFIIFGRLELQKYINMFEEAIKLDSMISKIDEEEIKKYILDGYAKDGITGFSRFYDAFSKSDEAYSILEIIAVRVCPYCNRQYTFTARKNSLKSRPQFDHFFPKKSYPYLAASVYNLIPSCALCNCGKSKDLPNNILYPYEESFESKNIHFSADEIIPYLLGVNETIDISLKSCKPGDTTSKEIIDAYYKCFKIKILYELHSDCIEDLITKKAIFNKEAIENIYNSYSEILDNPQHLENLIFGKYDSDCFVNQPLSKLTSDIWDQI